MSATEAAATAVENPAEGTVESGTEAAGTPAATAVESPAESPTSEDLKPKPICWGSFLELHKKFRVVLRKSQNKEYIHVHDLKLCLDLFDIEVQDQPDHGLERQHVERAIEDKETNGMRTQLSDDCIAQLLTWQAVFLGNKEMRYKKKREGKGKKADKKIRTTIRRSVSGEKVHVNELRHCFTWFETETQAKPFHGLQAHHVEKLIKETHEDPMLQLPPDCISQLQTWEAYQNQPKHTGKKKVSRSPRAADQKPRFVPNNPALAAMPYFPTNHMQNMMPLPRYLLHLFQDQVRQMQVT